MKILCSRLPPFFLIFPVVPTIIEFRNAAGIPGETIMILPLGRHQKEVFYTIYQRIFQESARLQEEIRSLKEQLKDLPDGKLICCHHRGNCKWYQNNGQGKIYIPKSNRPLAEQLARKNYLSSLLEDLTHEKMALDLYLKHHRSDPEKARKLLEIPGYQELLSPFFTPLSQELSDWMNAPFTPNPKHPENLIHQTLSGRLVRSKSEAMIDLFLYTHLIPFRYEASLELNGTTFYPDFTIRHPRTGEFFYWEHFGLMDDLTYAKNACSKLYLYSSHGIIPSINLITTYETQKTPLSTEVIQKIIEHYFL